MTVLVRDMTGAGMVRDRTRDALHVETFSDLGSVEALWRGLEALPTVVMSPYQRFDWVRAFVEAEVGTDPARQATILRVLVLRDAAGRPQALVPLWLSRSKGVRVARVVGAKHANYHMPLYTSPAAATIAPDAIVEALTRAGREESIDAFQLDHQPRFWDGSANPLGARGRPCPSDAYGLMLGPDPEATLKRAFSADARKKLRAKERKLVEAFGPIEHRIAVEPGAIAEVLDAFHAQKRARFSAMGISNPYAPERIRRFVDLATARSGTGVPAVEVHALVAARTGRVLATFGGAVTADRFSGMWTSFDTDPELGRFSPGDLLLHRLIAQQTAAGRRGFDLGVGEARYKSSICDETIELVAVLIPVSLRGHLFALTADAAAAAKHRIKRSPRLLAAVRRLRRGRDTPSG